MTPEDDEIGRRFARRLARLEVPRADREMGPVRSAARPKPWLSRWTATVVATGVLAIGAFAIATSLPAGRPSGVAGSPPPTAVSPTGTILPVSPSAATSSSPSTASSPATSGSPSPTATTGQPSASRIPVTSSPSPVPSPVGPDPAIEWTVAPPPGVGIRELTHLTRFSDRLVAAAFDQHLAPMGIAVRDGDGSWRLADPVPGLRTVDGTWTITAFAASESDVLAFGAHFIDGTTQDATGVWRSHDGRTWDRLQADGLELALVQSAFSTDDGWTALQPVPNASHRGEIPTAFTSRDGVAWTARSATTPYEAGPLPNAIRRDGGYLMLVRPDDRPVRTAVWWSPDSAVWTESLSVDLGASDDDPVMALAANATRSVAVGRGAWWSADAVVWIRAEVEGGPTVSMTEVVSTAHGFVAVGYLDLWAGRTAAWTSRDGRSWTLSNDWPVRARIGNVEVVDTPTSVVVVAYRDTEAGIESAPIILTGKTTVASSPGSADPSPTSASLPVDTSIEPVSVSKPSAAAAEALRVCQVLTVHGIEKVTGMGRIEHARDAGHYAPFTGLEPELDTDDPAWIITFGGELPMPMSDEVWIDPTCVHVGKEDGIFATGPVRVNATGITVAPRRDASRPDRALPPLLP